MVKGKEKLKTIAQISDGENQTRQNPFMAGMSKSFSKNLDIKRCTDFPLQRAHKEELPAKCTIKAGDYRLLFQALHLFSKEMGDYDSALYEIVRNASNIFQANCQIRLFSKECDSLILSAIHDQNPEIFQGKDISLDDFTVSLLDDAFKQTWLEQNGPFIVNNKTGEIDAENVLRYFWPFESQQPLRSMLVVPLLAEQHSIGLMILIRYQQGAEPFKKGDLCFACNFANIAGDVISLAQGYRALKNELADNKGTIESLQNSEKRFLQVFETSTDAIFICKNDGTIVEVNTSALEKYGYERQELIGQEISVISFDYLSLNFDAGEAELSEYNGEPFECLTRQKSGNSIYTEVIIQALYEENNSMFQINARDISERVQTQNKLKTHMNRLHSIRAIDLVMQSNDELHSILEFILNQIKLELEVSAVALSLLDTELNTLKCMSAQGFKAKLEEKYLPDMHTSYAAAALNQQKIIYKNNSIHMEREKLPSFYADEGFESYCVVPLIVNDQTKGIIETFGKEKIEFNYDWINFLETLAGHAAISIENFQLFADLRQSNIEITDAYDATIEGWSRALDLRDNETEGHTERVAEITILLAEEAGFTEEEIIHIRRGALLHDIGKIGIPDSILLKPGKLDEEEWVLMKKHPQFAYDMLSGIGYLKPALDIPFCHHEKWDGSGYPRGLAGEDIPFAARLFAVVDVWDALRSDRPYREGWPEYEVMAYIKDKNGSHFDPAAVEVFFQVMNRKKYGKRIASLNS